MMHFRAKELNKRSTFPAKEMGKRILNTWNHDRVYIDRAHRAFLYGNMEGESEYGTQMGSQLQ